MSGSIATTTGPSVVSPGRAAARAEAPAWMLRIDEGRVALVLEGASLPGGAVLDELVLHLPHVDFPFDFREGVGRFRHHRGRAQQLSISVESRLLLDWIHQLSGGGITGRATDDSIVLMGVAEGGARYTATARFVPEGEDGEPGLLLSLYDLRVYGPVSEPWPLLASRILDLLPASVVAHRTPTTARLHPVRLALTHLMADLGWKLPDLSGLIAQGVELRDGRLTARFLTPELATRDLVTLDAVLDRSYRASVEHFLEDLELKRHHGQIDRLLAEDNVREALAEVYRAQDGPVEPGFLAERLIGICAAQPILYDEGEKVCRELLEENPAYPPALCGLASIAMGRGRPEEAAIYVERLSVAWRDAGTREDATAADLTLAELLAESDGDEARAALERVLRRSPDHEEALEALIVHAERVGDDATAVPLYKRLLFSARTPSRTREAGLRLARHALGRHAPDEARVFLQVVLEASPHDTEARMALAEVEVLEGRPEEGARILEAALRTVAPSQTGVLATLLRRLAELVLTTLDEPGRARRVLWRAVDAPHLGPADALSLARLALRAGEPMLAARYADRVPRDEISAPEAGCLRGRAHLERGDREAALTEALDVLEESPGHGEALLLLEEAATGVEVRERLLYRLRQAVSRVHEPGPRSRLHLALAHLYESLDLGADAVEPYEVALESDSDGPNARGVADRLLQLYGALGMWERHQSLCLRLLDQVSEPLERVPLLVDYGRAAQRELGDPSAAREALVEATELAPRRPVALELLWEALESLGQLEEAIPVLRRVYSVHPEPEIRRAAGGRLATLLVEVLGAPGQARAVLKHLAPGGADDAQISSLRESVGLPPFHTARSPEPISRSAHAIQEAPPAPAPSASERYADAVRLADAGEAALARQALYEALEVQPGYVPARELLKLLDAGPADTNDDLSAPSHGLDPEPQAPSPSSRLPPNVQGQLADGERMEALLGEALGLSEANQMSEAHARIDEVLEMDADHVQALELKATLLQTSADWRALASILERLADLAFDSRMTRAYTREQALVLEERLGDREAATKVWARYLRWEPLDDEAFARLVGWYTEREAWKELGDLHGTRATAAAERAPETPDPAALEMEVRRARLAEARVRLFREDDPDGALVAAAAGLSVEASDPELLEIQIRALAMTNQREACRETIDRLLPQLVEGPLRDEMLLLRGGP